MLLILLYSFIAVLAIQFIYYLFVFTRLAFAKTNSVTDTHPAISVIVCAKNEAENLKENLPALLGQQYSKFEIVLINDASYDETLDIMEDFAKQYPNIKIVNVENNEAFWGNKKYALTLGIKAASYDYLLFTDADCQPASNQWIKQMAGSFSAKHSFVLGYGAYEKKKHSLLNALIRYETLLTAIQYFSYAKSGNPYMGVGRNLAYHKNEFFKINGFINHMKIRSGDDDLFINEAATGKNTTINFHKDAHTISKTPSSFTQWFRQKRRHISTAHHYKFKDQFFLGLYYFTNLSFWILLTVLLSFRFNWELVLMLLGAKLIIQYIIFGLSAKKLNEQNLIITLPFLEVFLILFQLIIFIANRISKPNHWK